MIMIDVTRVVAAPIVDLLFIIGRTNEGPAVLFCRRAVVHGVLTPMRWEYSAYGASDLVDRSLEWTTLAPTDYGCGKTLLLRIARLMVPSATTLYLELAAAWDEADGVDERFKLAEGSCEIPTHRE